MTRKRWPSMVRGHVKYFKERLDNPALLDQAVIVRGQIEYLAVPVGGRRRGGWLSLCLPALPGEAEQVAAQLTKYPMLFPNVRVEASYGDCIDEDDGEYPAVVAWGDESPPLPAQGSLFIEYAAHDRANGLLYGYSDASISAFLKRWE